MTYLVAAAAIAFMGILSDQNKYLSDTELARSGGELPCPAGSQHVDLSSDGSHPGHCLRSGHQKQEAHPDWSEERDVRPGHLCLGRIPLWLFVRVEAQQVRDLPSALI